MSKKKTKMILDPIIDAPANPKKIQKAADKLLNAFWWKTSPQGEKYWNEVHTNLYKFN